MQHVRARQSNKFLKSSLSWYLFWPNATVSAQQVMLMHIQVYVKERNFEYQEKTRWLGTSG